MGFHDCTGLQNTWSGFVAPPQWPWPRKREKERDYAYPTGHSLARSLAHQEQRSGYSFGVRPEQDDALPSIPPG